MSWQEYQDALKRGYFQSHGLYNLGEEDKGCTYFTPNPNTARYYASGIQPFHLNATPGRPAVVAAIKDIHDPALVWPSRQEEYPIQGKIPTSLLDHVWIGRPILQDEGEIERRPGRHGGEHEWTRTVSPSSIVALKRHPAPAAVGQNPEMGAPIGEGQNSFDVHDRGAIIKREREQASANEGRHGGTGGVPQAGGEAQQGSQGLHQERIARYLGSLLSPGLSREAFAEKLDLKDPEAKAALARELARESQAAVEFLIIALPVRASP